MANIQSNPTSAAGLSPLTSRPLKQEVPPSHQVRMASMPILAPSSSLNSLNISSLLHVYSLDDKEVRLFYAEKKGVFACIYEGNKVVSEVSQEWVTGIPKPILNDPKILKRFLEQSHISISPLDKGDYHVYVHQGLKGGGKNSFPILEVVVGVVVIGGVKLAIDYFFPSKAEESPSSIQSSSNPHPQPDTDTQSLGGQSLPESMMHFTEAYKAQDKHGPAKVLNLRTWAENKGVTLIRDVSDEHGLFHGIKVTTTNGKKRTYVWSSLRPISSADFAGIIQRVLSHHSSRPILLLSGTHGDKRGNTAMNASSLGEAKFFLEDLTQYAATSPNRIIVEDISDKNEDWLVAQINSGRYHSVILGWCYSDSSTALTGSFHSGKLQAAF
jgi:hypothetical protein